MAYAVHIKLEELEKDNKELRAMLAVQAAQIERNTTTIHQLLGGLFNQRTQARILNVYMSGLFVEDGVSASACETAKALTSACEAVTSASEAVTSACEAVTSEAADDEDDDEAASEAADEDEELENPWPTTRQGDEHSERLKEMEERFRKLEEQVVAMEKRQLEKFGSTE